MRRSQIIFRYIWRIDAVLILIASGAITVGVAALAAPEFGFRAARNREAQAGIPVAADPNTRLSLEAASAVPGTNVLRAALSLDRGSKGFSSGGYTETRNILFIEPGHKAAHWLLPDNDHLIDDKLEIEESKPDTHKRIATAVLVKPTTDNRETSTGTLLLFDPSDKNIVHVADGVRRIHHASLSNADLILLYERNQHLVVATLDPASLSKRSEQEIDIPQLK
jgi:hypothetical protein